MKYFRDYLEIFKNYKINLSFGLVHAFNSCFGQTYFISLYVGHFQSDYGLSHGEFGSLYSAGTVLSAFTLSYFGRFIDTVDRFKYTTFVVLGFCLGMALLATTGDIIFFFISIYLLRLTGQGLMSVVASTNISKLFNASRGKALAITNLGFPLSESLMPIVAVFVISIMHWKTTWWVWITAEILIFLPLVWYLIKNGESAETQNVDVDLKKSAFRDWTVNEAVKDIRFYLVVPALVLPAFVLTGLFLLQSELAREKGWTLAWLATCFTGFAIGRGVFSIVSGPIVDKYTARKILPYSTLPLCVGLALGAWGDSRFWALAYLLLGGVSQGFSGSAKTAYLAETYGTKYIGGIKSIFTPISVLATALSPFLFGLALDYGVRISSIMWVCVFIGGVAFVLCEIAIRIRVES